jgi:hypothetical protein
VRGRDKDQLSVYRHTIKSTLEQLGQTLDAAKTIKAQSGTEKVTAKDAVTLYDEVIMARLTEIRTHLSDVIADDQVANGES